MYERSTRADGLMNCDWTIAWALPRGMHEALILYSGAFWTPYLVSHGTILGS